jgi:hypothetical protein
MNSSTKLSFNPLALIRTSGRSGMSIAADAPWLFPKLRRSGMFV